MATRPKKVKPKHPFEGEQWAIYIGYEGHHDVYGDLTIGKSYEISEIRFASSNSPIMCVGDDVGDYRWAEAKHFIPVPIPPPTEAGAATYDEIMLIQDLDLVKISE